MPKTGSTTAPAHTLYEIVRKLPDGAQVELETASDGGSLVIRAGRSRFTLQCLPPADFPAMAEGDLPHRFQLPATDLKGIIDRTRFAISNEDVHSFASKDVKGYEYYKKMAQQAVALGDYRMSLADLDKRIESGSVMVGDPEDCLKVAKQYQSAASIC